MSTHSLLELCTLMKLFLVVFDVNADILCFMRLPTAVVLFHSRGFLFCFEIYGSYIAVLNFELFVFNGFDINVHIGNKRCGFFFCFCIQYCFVDITLELAHSHSLFDSWLLMKMYCENAYRLVLLRWGLFSLVPCCVWCECWNFMVYAIGCCCCLFAFSYSRILNFMIITYQC